MVEVALAGLLDRDQMANYRKLETGEATTKNDPARGLWYGQCGYWTDDWDSLDATSGIPACPFCGVPGFQTTIEEWFNGAERYEQEGHPRYVEFIGEVKGTCFPRVGLTTRYESWMKLQQ